MPPIDLEPAKNGRVEVKDGREAVEGRVTRLLSWRGNFGPISHRSAGRTLAGSVLSLVANVEFPNYPSDSQGNRNPQGNRRWFKATIWRSRNEHHRQCLRSLPSRRMTRHFVDVKAKKRGKFSPPHYVL